MSKPPARRLLPIVVVASAALLFAVRLSRSFAAEFAWDFAINWTAASALRSGVPLYDGAALRQIGLTQVGRIMESTFTTPYNSYIGPPTTALLYLPFTWLAFPAALALYRLLAGLAFGAAVLLGGLALPAEDRARGWLWGALALLVFDSVNLSLWLGQVDAWVMLMLALSFWAYRHERWVVAGIGAGVAALLKVSPGLLVAYFVLRGRWRAALASAVAMLGLLGLAELIGGGENLRTFLLVVAPALSGGSLHTQNQALPAYLARLLTASADLGTFTVGIGGYRLLSYVIGLAALLALWLRARAGREHALALPLLVLVALLIGPISWDHYTSWAIVALVGMADGRLWQGRPSHERTKLAVLLLAGATLLALPTLYFAPQAIAALGWLRLLTGLKTIGLLLWLVAGAWLGREPSRFAGIQNNHEGTKARRV